MAVPENDDGVTDVHEFLNVVADEKDRTVSVPHFVDEPVHHVPALPAQGGGGLINDEKLGFGTFGPGNFQKLALANTINMKWITKEPPTLFFNGILTNSQLFCAFIKVPL